MHQSAPDPKVSVVLPAFNASAFIREAVESIRGQTLQDWELIVIDDGSQDETAVIVQALGEEDGRIRLIRTDHGGIVAALNRGLTFARADFVARMDADDRSLPDRLMCQVKHLEACPTVGVVSCKATLFGDTAHSGGMERYVDWVNGLEGPESIALGCFVDAPVLHPAVCFRRELIERYGSYREGDFPEDYELWMRWMEQGVRFSQVPEVLLEWRDHPQKLTRTQDRYRDAALWALKGDFLTRWYRSHVDPGRPLVIWGAGRRTRSRLRHLSPMLTITKVSAWVDIDPRKIGQHIGTVPVIDPAALETLQDPFILSMVGSAGASALIRATLESMGKREGLDFLMLA